jgi:hypothetical protein
MKRVVLRYVAWVSLCLVLSAIVEAQNSSKDMSSDSCAALMRLNLTDAQGGPAIVSSAHIVDVPDGIHRTDSYPSGFSDGVSHRSNEIRHYCDVTGYVAPQNKFELKLPLPSDWNGNFFFYACGGFCGAVLSDTCDLGLMRGYASGREMADTRALGASTASGRQTRRSCRKISAGAAITS